MRKLRKQIVQAVLVLFALLMAVCIAFMADRFSLACNIAETE